MDSLSGWAQQVEEEMRPAIDRFGKEVGGLVTGLMDTIEDSPLFEHAIMNRDDGSAIITGDHSIGLAAEPSKFWARNFESYGKIWRSHGKIRRPHG